eukprot:gb/GECG01010145.1/.p1 GENE.gb/GECG01010145.1/~~gb/GECG01010145.1/.p1  ORF type:complete len:309 (+),score=62.14 gb/GECG01010145.1/:1-927(+)
MADKSAEELAQEIESMEVDNTNADEGGEKLSASQKKRMRRKKKKGTGGGEETSGNGENQPGTGASGDADTGENEDGVTTGSGGGGKKNKRGGKKKKKNQGGEVKHDPSWTGSKLPSHRGVKGYCDMYHKYGQTEPPSIPVSQLFPDGKFPQGEIQEHPGDFNTFRITSEEKRHLERLESDIYETLRESSEVHRQVRQRAHSIVKPGARLIDVCEELENLNRQLVQENGQERGIGFPTGCSLNHIAAHYTPNSGDYTEITYDDVCKIDFGTHINGRIIDCAFTVSFNPVYDPLLEAAKDATNTGIRVCY